MADDQRELTVYFDGSCPLCSIEIEHYRGQHGADAICFLDVSRSEVALGPELTRQQALSRFHVRRSNGEIVSGAAAFVSVWKLPSRWRWMARIADIPGVLCVMELAYRSFLPVRPRLSRLVKKSKARLSKMNDDTTPK